MMKLYPISSPFARLGSALPCPVVLSLSRPMPRLMQMHKHSTGKHSNTGELCACIEKVFEILYGKLQV